MLFERSKYAFDWRSNGSASKIRRDSEEDNVGMRTTTISIKSQKSAVSFRQIKRGAGKSYTANRLKKSLPSFTSISLQVSNTASKYNETHLTRPNVTLNCLGKTNL